jgi:hypothetical protein
VQVLTAVPVLSESAAGGQKNRSKFQMSHGPFEFFSSFCSFLPHRLSTVMYMVNVVTGHGSRRLLLEAKKDEKRLSMHFAKNRNRITTKESIMLFPFRLLFLEVWFVGFLLWSLRIQKRWRTTENCQDT